MTRTCHELGVCNGRHCNDVADCANYDLIACNSCHCQAQDDYYPPCPHAVFECELPCSPEPAGDDLYPWHRYPFAPGTIEGPKNARWSGLGEGGAQLTRRQNLSVLLLVLLLAVLGSVLGGFLAGYLSWPAWLTVGLPG